MVRPAEGVTGSGSDPSAEVTVGVSPPESASPGGAEDAAAPPGIDRYRILERLGAGGMATVWLAHDTQLDREVAVKLMRARSEDPLAQARMLREAQAMARVSHPNVVQVFDVGITKGAVYVAMERIEGRTLTQWLQGERPPWPRVVEAFVAVGRALQAVHDEGLVHRDFKPHNVMIGIDGRVRLIDFGLAIDHGSAELAASASSIAGASVGSSRTGGSLTMTGTVMGTPAYMSPEQVVGAPATAASDQFSFCVALYEGLHGQRPFSSESYDARIAAIRAGAIAAGRASIPGWLEVAIRRGLSLRAEDRFESMAALVARLERGGGRSRWLGAGAAACALLILGAWWTSRSEAAPGCAAAGSLDDLYGDTERAAIREALLGTGLGYADDTSIRVRDRLDGWASRWSSTWALACDPATTPARRDAVSECLKDGRQAFSEALKVLTRADARILERAGGLVDGLPDPQQCAATEHDTALEIPPEHEAAIERLRADLSRAQAMREAGQVDAAAAVTERALAEARALNVEGFTAEAAMAHGRSLDGAGDDEGAGERFEEAYHLASAHRRDTLAGRAAIAALDVAVDRNAMDEAERWARHAQAELSRLGDPPKLRASYLDKYAQVQTKRADYAGAEASLREALQLLARVYDDPEDPRLAQSTDHLGSCLENLGRLEEAASMHQRALEMFERGSGPNHPSTGRALANLANATSALGRKQEAHGYYRRSYEILRGAYGETHEDVGSALQGLGTAELALGNLEAARDALQRAYEIQVAGGGEDDPHAGIPLNNLGNVEMEAGRVDVAEGHYRRAWALYQSQLGDDHPWTALALANLARVDGERGDLQAGIDKYTRALEAVRASVGETHLYAGMMINNRALLRVKLGTTDGAREDFLRAYEIFAGIWGEDDPRLGESVYNLADLALDKEDRSEAAQRLAELDRLWAAGAPSDEDATNAEALRGRLRELSEQ